MSRPRMARRSCSVRSAAARTGSPADRAPGPTMTDGITPPGDRSRKELLGLRERVRARGMPFLGLLPLSAIRVPGTVGRMAVFRSPVMVGRDRELDRLRTVVARMVDHDEPAFVVIEGEPGVGKTRLAEELAGSLDSALRANRPWDGVVVGWAAVRCVVGAASRSGPGGGCGSGPSCRRRGGPRLGRLGSGAGRRR
jgi:hypothetical protein